MSSLQHPSASASDCPHPPAPASGDASACSLQTRRRRRIRRDRLRQSWPWLIWLIIGGIVFWSVSRGYVFERMNGQVEENYQYIAPAQEGRILTIAVKPGDTVEPGGLVAELDPEPWQRHLKGLLLNLASQHRQDLNSLQRERGGIAHELNLLREATAADEGRLAALQKAGGPLPARSLLIREQKAMDSRHADSGETTGRLSASRAMIPGLEARLAAMDLKLADLGTAAGKAEAATLADDPAALLALFPTPDRSRFQEQLDGLAHCRITSAKGGVVEKLVKSPGDYLLAGDVLLEMVGPPENITAFVSSDEAARLRPGDRVWVTPAHGRKWAIHESTVLRAAPDAERLPISSKAGSGAYQAGRRITVAFPPSALASSSDSPPGLLPGEGITVHTSHPGEIPFFRKLGSMGMD